MSYFVNFPKLIYSTSLGIKNFKIVPNILAKVTFLREVLQNSDMYYTYSVKENERPEDVAYKFYDDPLKHWIILLANEVVDPQYDWPLSLRSFDSYINKKYSSYSLKLNPYESYDVGYDIGEIVYQGSSIDKSSSDSIVIDYDETNHTLVVKSPTDIIANNTTISGSSSNVTHSIIGITCNDDGINWSQNTISHYEATEVKWNDYDEIKTTTKYRVSSLIPSSAESYLLNAGTALESTFYVNTSSSSVYCYDYEIELNEAKRNIIVPKPAYISAIEQEFKKLMI